MVRLLPPLWLPIQLYPAVYKIFPCGKVASLRVTGMASAADQCQINAIGGEPMAKSPGEYGSRIAAESGLKLAAIKLD